MSIFRRLILILTFLVVGYFAVYAGDGVKLLKDVPTNEFNEPAIALAVVVGVFVLGGTLWVSALVTQLKGELDKQVTTALKAVVALTCIAFVFGYLSTPFAQHGGYPWQWKTRYIFLLLIGIVPMIFMLEGVVVDFMKVLKGLRKKKELVDPARVV